MSARTTQLYEQDLLVVDTETTGLIEDPWTEVVELAAVVVDQRGNLTGEFFTSLLAPVALDERAARALAVNGLSRETLAGAPERAQVVDAFNAWLAGLGRPVAWRSWHAAFDGAMLSRLGVALPRDAKTGLKCSMRRAARALLQVGTRIGLDRAAFMLDVALPSGCVRHRALGDAIFAALVEVAVARMERRQVAGRLGAAESKRLLGYARAGRAAFRAGTVADANPEMAGSAEAGAWDRGWHEAQLWGKHAQVRAAEQALFRDLAVHLDARVSNSTSYRDAHASGHFSGGCFLRDARVVRVLDGMWQVIEVATGAVLAEGPFRSLRDVKLATIAAIMAEGQDDAANGETQKMEVPCVLSE